MQKSNMQCITGRELLSYNMDTIPVLIDPILPKVGMVALAGSSDTGKSTFLRQLATKITMGEDRFLGFDILPTHKSAIYVSTEDDKYSISVLLKMQNREFRYPIEESERLRYIFEIEDPIKQLDAELTRMPADIVVIDAFTDLYGGEMNVVNKVRNFLNEFGNLAQKHNCLIMYLHHTGKRTEDLPPSKHNLIGSQGFEAKMRMVMELRRDPFNPKKRHLCIVKGNYLSESYKNESFVLEFDDNMVFHHYGERCPFHSISTSTVTKKERDEQRQELIEKAKKMKKENHTQTEIAQFLKVDKSTISRWLG